MASKNLWGQSASVATKPANEWGQQQNVAKGEARTSWGWARNSQQVNNDVSNNAPQTSQGNANSGGTTKNAWNSAQAVQQSQETVSYASAPTPSSAQTAKGYNAPESGRTNYSWNSAQTVQKTPETGNYSSPPAYSSAQPTRGYNAPESDYTNGNTSRNWTTTPKRTPEPVPSYKTNQTPENVAPSSEVDPKYSWGAPKRIQEVTTNAREEVSAPKPTSGDFTSKGKSNCSFDFNSKSNAPPVQVVPSGDAAYAQSQPNGDPSTLFWGQTTTSPTQLWSNTTNTTPVTNLWGNSPSVTVAGSRRKEHFDNNPKSPTSPLSPTHPPVDPAVLEKLISSQLKVADNEVISYPDGQGGDNLRSCVLWQEFIISRDLMRGLAAMDFRYPSGIQARALPEMLTYRKHTLVQSQNGTGKTATYLITILSMIDYAQTHCQALVMVHTHELALQVADVARTMGKYLSGFRVAVAIPGTEDNSKSGPVAAQLVVGTPGTLWRWAAVKSAEKVDPSKLKVFVMDEADQLMETEAFNDTLRLLKKKLRDDCQLLFFSATFEENVRTHARNLVGPVQELKEILLSVHELALQNVRQFKMYCSSFEEKLVALFSIYRIQMISGCLVFCKTRDEAHKLADSMRARDHLVGVLTGKMNPQEREIEIERFRKSETRALISTNVCSRGLDIDHINLVVNWDLPILPKDPTNPALKADFDTYLHRVGRSGRFGRHGLAINFVANDNDNRILETIEKYFTIQIPAIDYSDVDDLERIKDPRQKDGF